MGLQGQIMDISLWLLLTILLKVTLTVGGEERILRGPSIPLHSPKPVLNNITEDVLIGSLSLGTTSAESSSNYQRNFKDLKDEGSSSSSSSYAPTPMVADRGVTSLGLTSGHLDERIVLGTVQTNSSTSSRGRTRKKMCMTTGYLDKCIAHMPPMPDIGIPSSFTAVESACKAFNIGMNCVDEWSEKCLKKENQAKFKQSISGAHETFTFLCRDPKFKKEFLQHGECYKRISYQWDECSRQFIENMKKYHSHGNATVQCCVRLSFLQCVAEISHIHCSRDAAKFLQRLAETLVRATMRTHVPPQCVSIQHRNCTMVNSSPSLKFHHKFTLAASLISPGSQGTSFLGISGVLFNFLIYYTPFAILLLVFTGY